MPGKHRNEQVLGTRCSAAQGPFLGGGGGPGPPAGTGSAGPALGGGAQVSG